MKYINKSMDKSMETKRLLAKDWKEGEMRSGY